MIMVVTLYDITYVIQKLKRCLGMQSQSLWGLGTDRTPSNVHYSRMSAHTMQVEQTPLNMGASYSVFGVCVQETTRFPEAMQFNGTVTTYVLCQ